MSDKIASSIPLNVPELHGTEWDYLKECLDTNWVSYAGPFVDRFEQELAVISGATRAVATNSGTSALHTALVLAGVQGDTEVVMPDLTFVAPANAVRYCGAWPVLLDVSRQDWQMDVSKLADFLAKECRWRDGALTNRHTNRRVSAIMPVHLLGGMADVDAIAELCAEYELPLVEDAAEAMGATYKGRSIAAPCPHIEASRRFVTTSFNGNKIITTGGGGAVFSNCEQTADRIKHLTTTAKLPGLGFIHDEVGFNYRLTNLAAAVGVAQLERLADHVRKKREIAGRYESAFCQCSEITLHPEPSDCSSTFWLYTILLDREAETIIHSLNGAGVLCRPLWKPMHHLEIFGSECYSYHCEVSDQLGGSSICLPSSVGLSEPDQESVVLQVAQALNR